MKRVLIAAALFLGLFVTARRFKLGQQAMKKCEEMMSHMGSDFPPKQMMERMQAGRAQLSGEAGCEGCGPEEASKTGVTVVA